MNQIKMTKRVTILSVLASLGLLAACGSDSDKSGSTVDVTSMGGAGSGSTSNTGGTAAAAGRSSDPCLSGRCAPSLFPFVDTAIAISDACGADCPLLAADTPIGETTATLSQPEAGKLCLSGVVSPGGWAQIGLVFAVRNQDRTAILKKFDANALGITQVAFTIDSPPRGGVSVSAAITTAMSCPDGLFGCFTYGFDLMTAPGSSVPANYTAPGPVVVPFANFKQTVGTQSFDTTALQHLVFIAGTGSYNFCIHDFKFLDALGNEVVETQQVDGGV
jgi:hypothetical protein